MNFEHITIKFGTGTEAFEDSPTTEIARILREIAEDFERDGIPQHSVCDINGKHIGEILILKGED